MVKEIDWDSCIARYPSSKDYCLLPYDMEIWQSNKQRLKRQFFIPTQQLASFIQDEIDFITVEIGSIQKVADKDLLINTSLIPHWIDLVNFKGVIKYKQKVSIWGYRKKWNLQMVVGDTLDVVHIPLLSSFLDPKIHVFQLKRINTEDGSVTISSITKS